MTKKILIADDDPRNRKLLMTMVRAEGYDCLAVEDGDQVLTCVGDYQPDLMLLDVMMPGRDGFELAHLLKQDTVTSHIPIMLLTALTDRESRLKGLESGAEEFLSKPIDRFELTMRLRNLLRLKEYSDRLEENNRHLQRTIELGPYPIMLHTECGEVINVNKAWSTIAGYDHQALPTLDDWRSQVLGHSRGNASALIQDVPDDDRLTRRQEWRIQTAFGEERIWDCSSSVLGVQEDGQRIVIKMASDVTDRKRVERDLINARDDAESATRSKSAFLAAMSHELRTPMNGVLGMVDLLRETRLSADQQRMLGTVRDSAFGLLNILDDILDFSKIEAGKLAVELIPVSLEQVMEGVCETLAPNVARRGVRLELHLDPALPARVKSDPVRLRQILYNLAGNAVKFTDAEDGRVTVRAKLERSNGNWASVNLRVIDNGIGMSDTVQAKLFQPFTQADDSTTRRYGGTGLGLSITQHLVQRLGGQIEVQSAEGEGAEFCVTLPMEITPEEPAGASDDLRGLRVWALVEDEPTRTMLSDCLSAAGAQLTLLSTGDVPATGERPDLAIMDARVDKDHALAAVQHCQTEYGLGTERCVLLIPRISTGGGDNLLPGVLVQTNPLLPSTLRHAVMVAAGRADAEEDQASLLMPAGEVEVPTREAAEAAGTLVLVAEDNRTNQDVLGRQLSLLGYAAVIVDDGRQALEQWRSGRFGLVLTDCHMPEMDGLELTQAIRQMEQGGEGRVPIVAITANAMQGEATHCLEAGMDDYLAKPVVLSNLRRLLRKWLPVKLTPSEEEPQETAASAGSEVTGGPVTVDATQVPILDPARLTDMIGDEPEAHARLLDKFMVDSARIIEDLCQAAEGLDASKIGALAHKLKSSAWAMGADRVGAAAEQLEFAGKAESWPDIEQLEPKLVLALAEVELLLRSDEAC